MTKRTQRERAIDAVLELKEWAESDMKIADKEKFRARINLLCRRALLEIGQVPELRIEKIDRLPEMKEARKKIEELEEQEPEKPGAPDEERVCRWCERRPARADSDYCSLDCEANAEAKPVSARPEPEAYSLRPGAQTEHEHGPWGLLEVVDDGITQGFATDLWELEALTGYSRESAVLLNADAYMRRHGYSKIEVRRMRRPRVSMTASSGAGGSVDGGLVATPPGVSLGRIEHPVAGFRRASGDVICEDCGKQYHEHPLDESPEATGFDGPFLRKLCNGERVKL